MQTREFQITNESGLHARPASAIAQLVSEFSKQGLKILLGKSDKQFVDASSVLELLTLQLKLGDKFIVCTEGTDTAQSEAFFEMLQEILGKK